MSANNITTNTNENASPHLDKIWFYNNDEKSKDREIFIDNTLDRTKSKLFLKVKEKEEQLKDKIEKMKEKRARLKERWPVLYGFGASFVIITCLVLVMIWWDAKPEFMSNTMTAIVLICTISICFAMLGYADF